MTDRTWSVAVQAPASPAPFLLWAVPEDSTTFNETEALLLMRRALNLLDADGSAASFAACELQHAIDILAGAPPLQTGEEIDPGRQAFFGLGPEPGAASRA